MFKNIESNGIIFYAPLNNDLKSFRNGGGEAGCLRTKIILEKLNYQIIIIRKPILKYDSIFAYFFILIDFIKSWTILFKQIVFNNIKCVHIVGFYKYHLIFEWIISRTAKLFKIKYIYEIRNGGMIFSYNKGNFIYKYLFKSIVFNSSNILCQGEDYVEFLKEKFVISSIYYPNFIMNDKIQKNNLTRKDFKIINLIYFGRIVKEKNIDFIIDICETLKSLNIDFRLNLFGGYEFQYYQFLQRKITSKNLNNVIQFHGRKDFDDIILYLKSSHFFIFPSKEINEGHSNALTEAMAFGIAPIVSDVGFNKKVVNDDDLVIHNFDPLIYAKKIIDIWSDEKWSIKSSQVYNRILENYTESKVTKSILELYHNL